MNLVPFSVRDLELSVVSGVEACMYKSDIKIFECLMGFMAQWAKSFPYPNQSAIFSTVGLLGMKMSSYFLTFLSIPVPTVSMQPHISSKVGVILEF